MNEFYRQYRNLFSYAERYPYEDILAYQAQLAEKLIRYVRDYVPVFSERVHPLFEGDTFRPERWGELQILTRRELQDATPALEEIAPPAEMGSLRIVSTSGSTGMPVRVRRTAFAIGMSSCMRDRVYDWYGFDTNARMARIVGVSELRAGWPEGKVTGAWSNLGPDGTRHLLSVFTPIAQQLEWLRRVAPRYLTTIPSNLYELAEAAGAAEKEIGIEAVVTTGSALLPDARSLAGKALGARVIETYGCEEVGLIAIECPASGHLHVGLENLIVEVLDEKDDPVEPGGIGRVVVTCLHNFATPLLRYEIGDLVETTEGHCPCGRTSPTLRRVIGRIRKAIVFPDGTRVRPHVLVTATGVPDYLPARQFQIVQTAPETFEIRYVPREADLRLSETIQKRFREMVHPAARVVLVPVKEIPRGPRGKHEDFVYLEDSKENTEG